MNTTNKLLDRIKDLRGLKSDYALAKHLGWTPQVVSNYRNERTQFDATACIEVAKELDTDPMNIMARVNIERAPTRRVKTAWEPFVGRLLLAIAIAGSLWTASTGTLLNADYAHAFVAFLAVPSNLGIYIMRIDGPGTPKLS